MATVNQLTQQIEDLKEATRDDSETVDTLKRKLETSLRDNDRMSKQNKDLGKIVDFFVLFTLWSKKYDLTRLKMDDGNYDRQLIFQPTLAQYDSVLKETVST